MLDVKIEGDQISTEGIEQFASGGLSHLYDNHMRVQYKGAAFSKPNPHPFVAVGVA